MSEEVFTEGGRLLKMEVDYSATVDEKVPVCEKLAKVSSASIRFDVLTNPFRPQEGKLQEALDTLLALEKQTRTVSDWFWCDFVTD